MLHSCSAIKGRGVVNACLIQRRKADFDNSTTVSHKDRPRGRKNTAKAENELRNKVYSGVVPAGKRNKYQHRMSRLKCFQGDLRGEEGKKKSGRGV